MHELSTDSEVTFRRVLGSTEVLPTRPGVDPLEVIRPLPDFSWTTQSPIAASSSVIVRQTSRTSPGPLPPAASYVFGPQADIGSTPDPTANPNIGRTLKPYTVSESKRHSLLSGSPVAFNCQRSSKLGGSTCRELSC